MSISAVSGGAGYTAPVRSQAPPRPPAPPVVAPKASAIDADGDHDGTKPGSLEVRA